MAKRLLDSADWDTQWFRRLPPKYKCLWYYMNLRSNHYGIWNVDLEIAEIIIGQELVFEEIVEHFGDKIYIIEEGITWFIPAFLSNNYNNKITYDANKESKNQLHKNSFPILLEFGIIDPSGRVRKDFSKSLRTLKDISKDKFKKKVEDKFLAKDKILNQDKTVNKDTYINSADDIIRDLFKAEKKGRILEDNSEDSDCGEPDGFLR